MDDLTFVAVDEHGNRYRVYGTAIAYAHARHRSDPGDMLRELGHSSRRAALFMLTVLYIIFIFGWLLSVALLLGCARLIFGTTEPREAPDENRQRGFEVLPPK
jgi:hypothetical protein